MKGPNPGTIPAASIRIYPRKRILEALFLIPIIVPMTADLAGTGGMLPSMPKI